MKSLTSTSFAAIAAGFLAFSAPAARSSDLLDGLNEPAPAQTRVDYTGPYILLGTGYAAGWNEVISFDDEIHVSSDGFFATGRLGYDFQFNRTVVGVFGDVNWENLDARAIETAEFTYAAGARVGHIVGGANLLYINGGFEFNNEADIDLDLDAGTDPSSFEFDRYFVGGGLESQIGGGFALGVEGRFAWSDDETSPTGNTGDGLNNGTPVNSSEISAMIFLKKSFGGF
jgi:hypothetical protein